MTAAALNRHPLALPGPVDGAFIAPHLDPRPCVTNPAEWWDTSHHNNGQAIGLCNKQCPLKTRCAADPDQPIGVIRAGVPYDDHGRAMNTCKNCDYPLPAWNGLVRKMCNHCPRDARPIDHHQRIAELRDQGRSYAEIADEIGAHPEAVRGYWLRYLDRINNQDKGPAPRPLVRLPGVANGMRYKPKDQHDVVVAMLTDPAGYTHADVAWVIGSTNHAVRTYWSKRCREHHSKRPAMCALTSVQAAA